MAEHRPRKPAKSQKLGRTLEELEHAFADWESLSSTKIRQAALEKDRLKAEAAAKSENSGDQEFAKKTKKLLSQLREQLAELTD